MASEIELKHKKLVELMDRQRLDGVLYTERANFAWITGGRDNHVASNTPVGAASILFTRDARICLTSTIEAPRFEYEELAALGIKVISYPWHDRGAGQKIVRDFIGARRVVCDTDTMGLGLNKLPPGFVELRWTLTDTEIARYREGARRMSTAISTACREVKPGLSEHEIAGILEHHVRKQALTPTVTLVAVDERIDRFRHPIPTDKKLVRYAMLVGCGEYRGLITSLTRFVHFGKPSDDLRKRQQAVANVDAAIILSTTPGRRFSEIFTILERAYTDNGYPDQWKLHHQGGLTGYAGREAKATPDSTVTVQPNQAFAWNPSITGVKSEDTILLTPRGQEVLTPLVGEWPRIIGHFSSQTLPRADALVL